MKMPKSCCAFGCTNHNLMTDKPSFHVFPQKDEKRWDKWVVAVGRKNPDNSLWKPKANVVICGKHFVTGKPHNDPLHPDWIPSIFVHRATASETRLKRYTNAEKRRYAEKENDDTPTPSTSSIPDTAICDTSPSPTTWTNPVSILKPTPSPLTPLNSNTTRDPARQPPAKKLCLDFNMNEVPAEHIDSTLHIELLNNEITNLRRERDQEKDRAEKLEGQLKDTKLAASSIKDNDKKSKCFTGLRWEQFLAIFTFLTPYSLRQSTPKNGLSQIDKFFITLVKLRLDMPFDFIAYQCGIGQSTAVEVFWRWINLMNTKLTFLIKWPDRDAIYATLPLAFKKKFPRMTSIVDCFEVFMEQPKNLKARAQVYSNYKKHCTFKVFIVCTPCGAVSFVSPVWGGRASDVQMVRESGFISPDLHLPGDQILADRGFTLQEDFATQCGAELIMPSFTVGHKQLPAAHSETSREKSIVRIHIERVIGCVKSRYTMLSGKLPVRSVKSLKDEALKRPIANIDKIVKVCCSLFNAGDSIIVKDEDLS